MNERANIQLHIERLVLDGISLSQAQRPILQAAVEAELGRLLTEGGLGAGLQTGLALPSISAPTIQLSPDGNPTQWGHQIAQSVYRGIGP